jgi:uncharacterized protein (DUF433 family)
VWLERTMMLPDFLFETTEGDVRVAGHRIRLIDVARCYNEGFSPEGILDCYPTLSLAVIHKCIAFCLENEPLVDRLLAEDARVLDALLARPTTTPDLAELRRRMKAIQQAKAS